MFCKAASLVVAVLSLASCGGPDNPSSKAEEAFARAKTAYTEGRLDESLRLLEAVPEARGSGTGKVLYARTLYFLQRYAQARSVLLEVVKDHPDAVAPVLWLARTYLQEGRVPAAEAVVRASLIIDPEDPRLAYQMALVQEAKGDPASARRFLDSAHLFDEDMALAHYESARIAWVDHDLDLARSHLNTALALVPATSLLRRPLEQLNAKLSR